MTFFSVPVDKKVYEPPSREVRERLRNNSTNGEISRKARRRISTAIDWMLYLSTDKKFYSPKHKRTFNFKLNFITLTLSSKQRHSDQVIKNRLLNQFLLEIKLNHNVKRYLWRAEAQSNGNIHFHVITDKFIPWSTLRKCWNRIQNKLGYVDAYRCEMLEYYKDGFKVREGLVKTWNVQSQKRAYKAGLRGNWSNPNSTDVHSIYKIRNLSAYLSKYFTKEGKTKLKPTGAARKYVTQQGAERNVFTVKCVERVPLFRPIDGKLWGLSHSLSKLGGIILEMSSNINDELTLLYNKYKSKFKFFDYYTIFYAPIKKWLNSSLPCTYNAFRYRLAEVVQSESITGVSMSLFSDSSPPMAMAG